MYKCIFYKLILSCPIFLVILHFVILVITCVNTPPLTRVTKVNTHDD